MRIEVGERILTVDVRRDVHGVTVVIDDRRLQADLVRVGSRWSLLLGAAGRPAGTAARSYEVAIDEDDGATAVAVNGLVVRTRVGRPVRWQPATSDASRATAGSGVRPVVAPMSGRVVKVLVQAGETVVAGQGLVVVEAMKMENELRAASGGIVTEVRVSEGALVDAGAVLVVVDSKVKDR